MTHGTKATALLVVWLVAYAVLGAAVWVLSGPFTAFVGLTDLWAIMVSVVLAAALGWLGASWVQRRVGSHLRSSAGTAG